MADFEALNLNITSNSESASAGIESLVKSLTALKGLTASFKDTAVEKTLQNISRLSSGIVDSISTLNIDSGFSSGIVNGLNQITSAVDAISDESIDRIERLANALERLGGPGMPDIDLQTRTSESASAIRDVLSSVGSSVSSGFGSALGTIASGTKTAFGLAGKGALASVKTITGALSQLYKGFMLGKSGGNQFVSSLARIAKYRFLRTIIKGVTDNIKTGLQNVARYSNEANAALSNFSTGSLYLKNSLGAALYPAIASLIGIFNSLINVVVRALNILSMFFSILGGKGTYIKATKQTKDYAGALGGAAGAAGALKQELMGFDEINALSPSGGGGGGGGGGLDYGSMFEEVPVESWLADMIASGDFSGLGESIAEKVNNALGKIPWNKAYAGAKKAADSLSSLINGFFGKINPRIIGQTIAGVVNTGATFVANFWEETNWEEIGSKGKQSLTTAIARIDAVTLGKAIIGKMKSMFRFLYGWVTSDGEGFFATAGSKIGEALNSAIIEIDPSVVATGIVGLISDAADGASNFLTTTDFNTLAEKVNSTIAHTIEGLPFSKIRDALVGIVSKAVNYFRLDSTLANIESLTSKITSFIVTAIGNINWSDVGIALAGIVNAIVTGISNALNGSEGKSGKSSIVSAVGSFISNIDFKGVINLVSLVFNSDIGTLISALTVFNVIKSALPIILSATGFSSGAGAAISLSALAVMSIIADVKDLILGNYEDKSEAVLSLIKKALFGTLGAGIAIAAGAGGLAIVATASISILASEIVFNNSASSEGVLSETVTQSINEAIALITQFSNQQDQIRALAGALTEISGITIPEDWVGANLGKYFAGSGIEEGALNVDALSESLEAFASAIQKASEEGTLDEFIANLGLAGNASESASTAVDSATSDTASAMQTLQEHADAAAASMGGYESAAQEAATAAESLSDSVESMPSTFVINAGSLDDLKTASVETSNALGGLSAFIAMIQRALGNLGGSSLFSPVSETANAASESAGALKSAIIGIPDSKSIQISLANYSTVISKLESIKKTINGITGKTITIQVKAGLTSGAKSFLNTLKGLTGGATASAIGKLISLSQFASGGFPKSGDIFIANENGRQELVGRIGSQPAVANQDQIGDAIFRYMDEHAQNSGGINTDELASAIVRGIKASGLGVVKLDGKIISGSINRETQRSGKPAIQF